MKDELAARRKRNGYHWDPAMDAEMHPRRRCVLTQLDDPPPRSLWQRFKDWRSRRRAERRIRGYYADLMGPR